MSADFNVFLLDHILRLIYACCDLACIARVGPTNSHQFHAIPHYLVDSSNVAAMPIFYLNTIYIGYILKYSSWFLSPSFSRTGDVCVCVCTTAFYVLSLCDGSVVSSASKQFAPTPTAMATDNTLHIPQYLPSILFSIRGKPEPLGVQLILLAVSLPVLQRLK